MSNAKATAAARAAEARSAAASQAEHARLTADALDSGAFKLKVKRVLDKEISANASSHITSRCLRLLHTLMSNVEQHPQEIKYRSFRSTQPKIAKEVLCVTGAKELLHLAGWKTRVQAFQEEWAFDEKTAPGSVGWSRLTLVVQCLDEHARNLEETAERIKSAQEREARAEKSRRTLAMSQAEEDRERVRQRVERERIGRQARLQSEQLRRQDAAAPTTPPPSCAADEREASSAMHQPTSLLQTASEDEDTAVPGHFSTLNGGQQLGGTGDG